MTPRVEPARIVATRAVDAVVCHGHSLDRALEAAAEHPERALIRELAFGTIRHYYSLRSEIRTRLVTPLKARDAVVEIALLVGAYQLRHMRVPAYAAVSESVRVVEALGRSWAKGLVNAVLRRVAREAPALDDDEARADQPQWLIAALRADLGPRADAILAVCNERAPMSLRVNRRRSARDAYRRRLEAAGIHARDGIGADALRLASPSATTALPEFEHGTVSVQDEGAQLAADLMPLAPGARVLDACAAPGGKAFHMLEREPSLELVALDDDPTRCSQVRAACTRFGLDPGFVVCGDATGREWWDGRTFDAVIVDAPCSGTGTLRRHPDIRLLKNEHDLPAFAALQRSLLENVWRTLRTGGTLIYCTCSILSVENDAVIDAFLSVASDAEPMCLDVTWGSATRYGRQLMPESGGPDGFFYAKLGKRG